jgi:BirA family biotin operon repressor/biotin-[acetyl-CoA-carboxylase] ligase
MTALLEAKPHANLIPLLAGIAVAETIWFSFGVEAELKWPNDVLIEGSKVAGVLVDANWSGDERGVILLGIGVNLNNALPEDLEAATTLAEEEGEEIDVKPFLGSLLERLEDLLLTLDAKRSRRPWVRG